MGNSRKIIDSLQNSTWGIGLPFARMDILGYSDLMRSAPIIEQITKLDLFVTQAWSAEQSIYLQPPPYQFLGDEILIYPDNGHSEEYSVRTMVYFLSALMRNSVLCFMDFIRPSRPLPPGEYFQYVPLRGALSFGDLWVEKEHQVSGFHLPTTIPITLGNSVIKAYEWEKAQKWVGASIDPGSYKKLKDNAPQVIDDLKREHYLVQWDIPTKDGLIESLAINFIRKGDERSLFPSLKYNIEGMENRMERQEDKAKYTATRLFVDHIKNKELYVPHSNKRDSESSSE